MPCTKNLFFICLVWIIAGFFSNSHARGPRLHRKYVLLRSTQSEISTLELAAHLSSIVYETDAREIKNWTCSKCTTISKPSPVLHVLQSSTERVMISVHGAQLFVTFRGDIQPVSEKLEHIMPLVWGRQGVLRAHQTVVVVNDYALQKLKSVYVPLRKKLYRTLKSTGISEVVFTGHSMGGCLSLLSAVHFMDNKLLSVPPKVYTFNSPRTGSDMFNAALTTYGIQVYRVVEENDVVTHTPMSPGFEYQPGLLSVVQGRMYNCTSDPKVAPCTLTMPSMETLLSNLSSYIDIHFQFFQQKRFFTYFSLLNEDTLKTALVSLGYGKLKK